MVRLFAAIHENEVAPFSCVFYGTVRAPGERVILLIQRPIPVREARLKLKR